MSPKKSLDACILTLLRLLFAYSSAVCLSLGTVGMGLFSLAGSSDIQRMGLAPWLVTSYSGRGFVVSSILIFVGGLVSFKQGGDLLKLKAENSQLHAENSQYEEAITVNQKHSQQIYRIMLSVLASAIGLDHNARISLYSFSNNALCFADKRFDDGGYFSILQVYSINPRYSSPEDVKVFPFGCGCVGLACERSFFHIFDLPSPDTPEYMEALRDRMRINNPEEICNSIRMKSRAFAGYAIKGNTDTLGVIVFESVQPNGLNLDQLDRAMITNKWLLYFQRFLEAPFMPSPNPSKAVEIEMSKANFNNLS